ncbi:MAG: hypothetical protein ACOC4M_16795, partial [Promethearchaeia archaeon]
SLFGSDSYLSLNHLEKKWKNNKREKCMKSINIRAIGVLLALVSLMFIPFYTILTVVLYFLDIYGFSPLIPEILKALDWGFFLILGGSLPIYLILGVFILAGYQQYKDPEADLNVLIIPNSTNQSLYFEIYSKRYN